MSTHRYEAQLQWAGDPATGTQRYEDYSREFRVQIGDKPELVGSADPNYRGDPSLYNPEDLLLAAIAGCHMLSYLAVCAKKRVNVVAYSDRPTAEMETKGGAGHFVQATLRPRVVITDPEQAALAAELHETAGRYCFIAASVNFPIHHEPEIVVDAAAPGGA